MSQFHWIMLDDFGHRFKVGLYHGDRSGHLLVYCNMKVIIIDFNVKESKKYSFYLGEEFCELNLDKQKDRFYYSLTQNQKANTPLNIKRRIVRKQHLMKTILIAATLVTLIVVLLIVFRRLG